MFELNKQLTKMAQYQLSNTHPNAYFLTGSIYSHLQYAIPPEDLIMADDDVNEPMPPTLGWELVDHTIENLKRVIPHTKDIRNYKIVLMVKNEEEPMYKAAVMHRQTGKISLLSSTSLENHSKRGTRPILSNDPDWYVGHYYMLAHMHFWRELSNRLKY